MNIVTIGGGSGHFQTLSCLREMGGVDVTAVVSMVDSGGSTGRLRKDFGTSSAGDVLKCVLALSPHGDLLKDILLKRFKSNHRLRGHNIGNLLLTILELYTDSFSEGVKAFAEVLDVEDRILPVTLDKATLIAELTDGERIFGEDAINIPKSASRKRIRDIFIAPHYGASIRVHPPVVRAIHDADYIIIGPGDVFTSIIPNLIVPGVREALESSRATLIYIVNIMTKSGETNGYKGRDFVKTIEKYSGAHLDIVICNTEMPGPAVLADYKEENTEFVVFEPDAKEWEPYKVYGRDILNVTDEGVVRHDPRKLSILLKEILGMAA
ncbi:MAG: YvcK family protein [Desulfobacterales bacterium]|nr:YvcK family protein [Desulfobacterales bacterium]